MRSRFGLLIFLLALGWLVSPTLMAQPEEFELWPDGLPAGSVQLSDERLAELKAKPADDHIYLVEQPTITVFPAGENSNGCGVVIFPGGGYNVLAWDKEGTEIANWFNSIGVTAAVVKYRVPRRSAEDFHLEPLQDGQRDPLAATPRRAVSAGFEPHWRVGIFRRRTSSDHDRGAR